MSVVLGLGRNYPELVLQMPRGESALQKNKPNPIFTHQNPISKKIIFFIFFTCNVKKIPQSKTDLFFLIFLQFYAYSSRFN